METESNFIKSLLLPQHSWQDVTSDEEYCVTLLRRGCGFDYPGRLTDGCVLRLLGMGMLD
jgi:hypothetical protein